MTTATESGSTTPSLMAVAQRMAANDDQELPVLPEVSAQLLKLTSHVDCDPREIVHLFKRDQSLTGHLLKIANSARYSAGQPVVSIQQAVARLGIIRVREIVVLISAQSTVFNAATFKDDVKRSFEISVATAGFAQETARVKRLSVEDAFLCGLLHDIGRPVLLQSLHNYRQSNSSGNSDQQIRDVADAVRIEMSCRLIRSWELPPHLANTVRLQEAPFMSDESLRQQAGVLNLAILLGESALRQDDEFCFETAQPMVECLNLYPEDLTVVLAQRESIVELVRSVA